MSLSDQCEMLSRLQKGLIDAMKAFLDTSLAKRKVSPETFFSTFLDAVAPKLRSIGRPNNQKP